MGSRVSQHQSEKVTGGKLSPVLTQYVHNTTAYVGNENLITQT